MQIKISIETYRYNSVMTGSTKLNILYKKKFELSPFHHSYKNSIIQNQSYLLRYFEYSASPCFTECADNGELEICFKGFTATSCESFVVTVAKAEFPPVKTKKRFHYRSSNVSKLPST